MRLTLFSEGSDHLDRQTSAARRCRPVIHVLKELSYHSLTLLDDFVAHSTKSCPSLYLAPLSALNILFSWSLF